MAVFIASAPELVTALGGRWRGRRGMARCPAHPDRTPGLSVTEGDDARPLVFCHGGCTQQAVLDALRARGLWSDRGEREVHPAPDPAVIKTRRLEEARERQQRLDRARTIWREAASDCCRDPVRAYL